MVAVSPLGGANIRKAQRDRERAIRNVCRLFGVRSLELAAGGRGEQVDGIVRIIATIV